MAVRVAAARGAGGAAPPRPPPPHQLLLERLVEGGGVFSVLLRCEGAEGAARGRDGPPLSSPDRLLAPVSPNCSLSPLNRLDHGGPGRLHPVSVVLPALAVHARVGRTGPFYLLLRTSRQLVLAQPHHRLQLLARHESGRGAARLEGGAAVLCCVGDCGLLSGPLDIRPFTGFTIVRRLQ